MSKTIEIVDRGRGWQLSTSRITVQDLVPYFQDGCTHEEILRAMPSLTRDEITVVEQYYRRHQLELDEEDRRIRERNDRRQVAPDVEEALRRGGEKMAALREEFRKRKQQPGRNGDNAAR